MHVVAGFVRGLAVPGVETQYYACADFEECRTKPVPQSKYKAHNPRHCRTHREPMNVEVVKDRRQ
jgi:hypothetical protein